MIKEACTGNILESINAERLGATRIELCENLNCGGTTPSYGTIKILKEKLNIPIVVMIRPRCGNFVYSESEFDAMIEDIKLCKELKVDGVAFGILTSNNEVDKVRTKELINLAYPLKSTFHKAIDETKDITKAFKDLKDLGVSRILTSFGNEKAEYSVPELKKIVNETKGQIEIVVAGKVTKENLLSLHDQIGSDAYHGKLIVGSLL